MTDGVELYKSALEDAGEIKGYDLYVFDGIMPGKLPEDGNIMVFNPGPNELFMVEDEVEMPRLRKSGMSFSSMPGIHNS